MGGWQLVRLSCQLVERLHQALPVAEAFGREVGRQLQGGDARALDGIVFEPERVAERAERAAAFAEDRLLALVQSAADNQKRRQFRCGAAHSRHHAAQGRAGRAGQGFAVQSHAAGRTAGQADGAGHAVIVRAGVQRTHQGETPSLPGNERKQFADTGAGDRRGDGREGAAVFQGRVRFRIPGVEVSRPAP